MLRESPCCGCPEAPECEPMRHECADRAVWVEELYREYLRLADKEIPQRPLPEPHFYNNGKCPRCGVVFMDKSTKYCGNCGQALNWEEA